MSIEGIIIPMSILKVPLVPRTTTPKRLDGIITETFIQLAADFFGIPLLTMRKI